tara:strand:+ start:3289 stop:3489 length:201 start_codon:yes stop_codon:yes gene_type:complete
MEIKPGTIPFATLAFFFAGLQIWWITLTIKNGRSPEKIISNLKGEKSQENDLLKNQRERLEKLLEK